MDLTPKQEGFAKDYLDTGNATEAAARNYNVSTRESAAVIGSNTLRSVKVREYLEDKSEAAASTIFELSQKAKNENVKLGAAKDILDRTGHKPTDKTEHSGGVEVRTYAVSREDSVLLPSQTENSSGSEEAV